LENKVKKPLIKLYFVNMFHSRGRNHINASPCFIGWGHAHIDQTT